MRKAGVRLTRSTASSQADPAAPETGTFPSLVSLQEAINRFIERHNQEPSRFVWNAEPKDLIAAKRGHQTLETIH